MDLFKDGGTRDLVWMATGCRLVIALGDVAAAACRQQGVAHVVFPDPNTDAPEVWTEIGRRLDELAAQLPLDEQRYLDIRDLLFSLGYKEEWEWAQSVAPPESADEFAREAIWVICCSGFREQAARVTQEKVLAALAAGRSATQVFPKSGKGRAIDTLWARRNDYFTDFQRLLARGATPEEIVDWIVKAKLPYVGGGILRYHFAKNLGVSCAKPDRHVARLCGVPEDGSPEDNFQAAMTLCRSLSAATGDKVGTVDLILWRACNLGILNSLAVRDGQGASVARTKS
jgi:hypothetical protein